MKRRLLRWCVFGYFLLLGLLPSVAHASDWPPDDPSRSDCKSAASTARSPLVPIAGAAAGAGAGWVINQVLEPRHKPEDGEGEEEAKPEKDPCKADLDRYGDAAMRARIFQSGREDLENLLRILENEYENTRQASFWSASIDVAFMAGSLWTKPVAGMLGKELLEQTLGQKLREAALKTFGQELTKTLMTRLPEHGINWLDVAVKAPFNSAYQTALQEAMSKILVQMEMERFQIYGIDPKGSVGQALERNVGNEIVGPLLDGYFGLVGLYETGKGAVEGVDKLQEIRAQMSKVRQNLAAMEAKRDDALDDMRLARNTLEHCRRIWAQK